MHMLFAFKLLMQLHFQTLIWGVVGWLGVAFQAVSAEFSKEQRERKNKHYKHIEKSSN